MFFIMQALADPSQSNQLYEIITKALFGSDKAESVTKMYPPDVITQASNNMIFLKTMLKLCIC